ncbi:uncharacterized protein LOC124459175 [Xenia sp. Carnegie-2017]|uniref:uncharacterized protein LOC124459175 n=1 Tax=Xenia sp. Carnegie-2017 TaxID=2897299 RepID=UPI001F04D37E|nr:uncharacterized protein LOC124459175 [Xenia sp. Carnegie-2017]
MATKQPEEELKYEDFLHLTVSSLKDFLALRGLKQTGKKAELIARAFGAYELKVPKKFTQEQIYKNIREEYSRRLKLNSIKTDPNLLPEQAWLDDVRKWPEIDDGKLFSYILRIKAVDVDYIGKYKDQKAYSYWMRGFVDIVYVAKCPSDGKFTFLKGNICPSQKLNDDPHKVWVCVEGTGSDCRIVTSWCSCTAGTAEACNHVIALLYKDRKTKKVSNRDSNLEQKMQKEFDPRKHEDRQLTDERVSSLLKSVKDLVPSACVLFSVEYVYVKYFKDIPVEQATTHFLIESQITKDQVKKIEQETRQQHSNPLWRKQRIGRITASNFHMVHTKTETIMKSKNASKKKPQYSPTVFKLVNESGNISHLPQIKWGVEHEKDGIKSFLSDVASQHDGGIEGFRQCGLYVKSDYPYLAASPDGLFSCKCCAPATVEVKCPYSVRYGNIMKKEVFQHVDFLEEFNGNPRLKRSHCYYTQVQAQMWVCGVHHSFFVVWTLGHQPLYEEIELDMAFMTNVVNNLTIFYKTYVMPCILGYRDLLQCSKCEKVILDEAEINCPATERSVTCVTCNTQWHLPCAGLTERCLSSIDSWLCHSCLLDNAGCYDDNSFEEEEISINDTGLITSQDCSPLISDEINNICPVCMLKDIHVGGEHICSICKNAVHAWCSNHEEITSSANLVCNYCKSD